MKKLLISVSVLLFLLFLPCCTAKQTVTEPPASSPCTQPSSSKEVSSPEPAQPVVTEIVLEKTELTLSQGKGVVLSAKTLPEEARNKKLTYRCDDPTVAHVAQSGKITALAEGTATITVSAPSGVSAQCSVTVTPREEDPMDALNYKTAEKVWYTYYYAEGLRHGQNGTLVFSANLWQLDLEEKTPEDYTAYLRFTYLPANEGEQEYVFPSIKTTFVKNESGPLDFLIQGKDADTGFCPLSGAAYKIELAIANKNSKRVVLYGTYEMDKTSSIIENNAFYRPTPLPGVPVKDKGQYYLSYVMSEGGILQGTPKQPLFPKEQGQTVSVKAAEGYRFIGWSDGSKESTRSDTVTSRDKEIKAYFLKENHDDSTLAAMYIFTETGEPILSKGYKNATMIIVGAKDPQYNITASLQIKGRGNSSWNADAAQDDYDSKNSYRIKFNDKEHLLGIGDSKNKDWVLNSNKFDLSGLRNYLIWELADRMGTFPYVPDCTWVQLYVNSEYRGMYMVSEHVEVANDRIEIDDTIQSTDKGYFIEADFRGDEEATPYFYVQGYGKSSNNNEREFVIKSSCTAEDVSYISKYIQSCHDAFVAGERTRIEELVDLQSLIDMYILEELSKDVDVGAASFFMQKSPGGKLYFTAPWDYDFGFGSFDRAKSNVGMISVGKVGCTWFAELLDEQWFRDAVLARMAELDDDFTATMTTLGTTAEMLKADADKNALFWKMYGTKYHPYLENQVSKDLNSYEEHIDFLKTWSTERWQIMKDYIGSYGSDE